MGRIAVGLRRALTTRGQSGHSPRSQGGVRQEGEMSHNPLILSAGVFPARGPHGRRSRRANTSSGTFLGAESPCASNAPGLAARGNRRRG